MKGFSLLELLIALTITAVLITIAIPTYHHHAIKVKRTDGKIALFDLAARLERYYAEDHSYATATIGSHLSTDVLSTDTSQQGFYRLSIVEQTNTTFLIQATPNPQKFSDKICGSLQLNHLGKKSTTTHAKLSCW
jgi:type IV pilus assembly protein PilE